MMLRYTPPCPVPSMHNKYLHTQVLTSPNFEVPNLQSLVMTPCHLKIEQTSITLTCTVYKHSACIPAQCVHTGTVRAYRHSACIPA